MSDEQQVMINVEYADMLERKVKDLQSKLDELQKDRHGNDGLRWNMHRSGDGELQVCFGEHERGTGCQYVTFVEGSRLETLAASEKYASERYADACRQLDSVTANLEEAESRLGATETDFQRMKVERDNLLRDVAERDASLAGSRSTLEEALGVLRPIAGALNQGVAIEPGSFSHDESARLTGIVVEKRAPIDEVRDMVRELTLEERLKLGMV